MGNKIFLFLLQFLFAMTLSQSLKAESTIDPCSLDLLALPNRPSLTGSACTIPNKKVMIEGGYQYFNLSANAHSYVVPLTEIRFGLPSHNEFLLILPTYFHQTISPRAGWSGPSISFKHMMGYNASWLAAVEAVAGLPSTGSRAYGNEAVSGALNGMVTYTYNPIFSVSGTLGVSSTSVRSTSDGQRFNSINPDIVASWQLNEKWLLFAEIFGQTRTSAQDGFGLVTDGGVFYVPLKNLALDAEVGQRLNGNWGFQNYAGLGFAWLL